MNSTRKSLACKVSKQQTNLTKKTTNKPNKLRINKKNQRIQASQTNVFSYTKGVC